MASNSDNLQRYCMIFKSILINVIEKLHIIHDSSLQFLALGKQRKQKQERKELENFESGKNIKEVKLKQLHNIKKNIDSGRKIKNMKQKDLTLTTCQGII